MVLYNHTAVPNACSSKLTEPSQMHAAPNYGVVPIACCLTTAAVVPNEYLSTTTGWCPQEPIT